MLRMTEEATKKARSMAAVGDLAHYHGRLVEVVEVYNVGDYNRASLVEFTDGGGLKRIFRINDSNPWSSDRAPLQMLSTPRDKILDAIALNHRGDTDPQHQLVLRTERWFADPKAGDLFHEHFKFWVCVEDVVNGEVLTKETVNFNTTNGWTWKHMVYTTADDFRQCFAYTDVPGYRVTGHSSRRNLEVKIVPDV